MADKRRIRRCARVLLLDEHGRVLLFRSRRSGIWTAPGGGRKKGEKARAAAAREIAEETGLREVALGAELWRRRWSVHHKGVEVDQRERWFVARVTAFEPDLRGLGRSEAAALAEWRWWTLDELAATGDRIVVPDLAARLRHLLEHGPPAKPLRLGG